MCRSTMSEFINLVCIGNKPSCKHHRLRVELQLSLACRKERQDRAWTKEQASDGQQTRQANGRMDRWAE